MLAEAVRDTISKYIRIKPTHLALLVTGKCNARCIMCDIWKEGIVQGSEMTLDEYGRLLDNRLLSEIRSVVLSGGEALLRSDIVELAGLLIRKLPALDRITIASNGLATTLITRRVEKIAVLAGRVSIVVQVSCDGVTEVHDAIRGPGAHRKVGETFARLGELRSRYPNLSLSSPCVIQPMNLNEVEGVYDYLDGMGVAPIFTVVCTSDSYYKNEDKDVIAFNEDDMKKVREILDSFIAREPNIGKKALYAEFLNMTNGAENSRSCPAARNILTIQPNGDVVPCLNSGDIVLGNVLKEDVGAIWHSRKAAATVSELGRGRCRTCMFACGIGYAQVLKFAMKYYASGRSGRKAG